MKRSIIAAAVLLSALTAQAVPVQWTVASGGNGHLYERIDVSGGLTWDAARIQAESLSYMGVSGYLMTITSQGESDFLANYLASYPIPDLNEHRFWIGAYQPPGSNEPDGNWQWITGETWGFTNWGGAAEPNNAGGDEDVVHLSHPQAHWNDVNRDFKGWNGGYVVEYVLEPATLGLLALGGLVPILSGLRRKK